MIIVILKNFFKHTAMLVIDQAGKFFAADSRNI